MNKKYLYITIIYMGCVILSKNLAAAPSASWLIEDGVKTTKVIASNKVYPGKQSGESVEVHIDHQQTKPKVASRTSKKIITKVQELAIAVDVSTAVLREPGAVKSNKNCKKWLHLKNDLGDKYFCDAVLDRSDPLNRLINNLEHTLNGR